MQIIEKITNIYHLIREQIWILSAPGNLCLSCAHPYLKEEGCIYCGHNGDNTQTLSFKSDENLVFLSDYRDQKHANTN